MIRSYFIALLLVSTQAIAANETQVKKNANLLSDFLSNGRASTVKTKSNKPEQMAKEYFLETSQEDPASVVSEATSYNSDESEIGIFKSRKIALDLTIEEMNYCVENGMVDNEDTAVDESLTFTAEATEILYKIGENGVYFGYDANGQGWGGMPISIMLVIDTKAKEVHAVTLQCNAYHD